MQTDGCRVLSTLRDWVRWGASRFEEAGLWYGHGTDNALSESLALVLHVLHLSHNLPPQYLDARVTPPEAERILALLQRRVEERVPLAYLTHTAWFAGIEFYVNENVLVPRSPIAELIESRFEPWLAADDVTRVLDLCTGCGCIAIACAYSFVEATVDAADISPSALAVARVNVERYQLADQINLLRSDVYGGLGGAQYDLIVSNPPYVKASEMDELPEEYRHEPALGLEAGEDGLDIATRILRDAASHLRPGGIIVMEVGNSADALAERFPSVPFLWLEFEHGGSGVMLLTAEQLDEYQAVLMA
jgi:ribosomal protein L3 glutamine methyltransferase